MKMINRIIDFSVEHKLAVLTLMLVWRASPDGGPWSRCHWIATPDLSDTQVINLLTLGTGIPT